MEKNIINFHKKNNKKENNKKENNKKQIDKFKRVSLELQKTDIYFMQIDVPLDENKSKENTMAIKIAWDMINKNLDLVNDNKKINIENFRIGDSFKHKILKKEIIEHIQRNKK